MALRNISILYGSQTGTAQDVAERISRESKRHHVHVSAMSSLNDYNISNLIREKLAVFVVATTGQGDPPDNMLAFWKFILRKNLPSGSLKHLNFAVIGLGDSSYLKFNFIAKKLRRRILQLGANEILEMALADDQHDLGADGVIDPWLQKFWERYLNEYPLPPDEHVIDKDVLLPPKYKLKIFENLETENDLKFENASICRNSEINQDNAFKANLISNERVTNETHWQDIRLIRMDISNSGIHYSAGDVLMIQPQNMDDTVEEFMQIVGLNGDQYFYLQANDENVNLPSTLPMPCKIDYLVRHYLDINGKPKRYFWELLAQFTTSDLEKEKLKEYCTPEGQEDMFAYCYRPRRTILEILQDFPYASQNIPVDYLFDLVSPLQPRAFSIASSFVSNKAELELLMAVVKYKTKLQKPRCGVCSTWLATIDLSRKTNVTIPIWVKKGTLTLPQGNAKNKPIIMIGPGTGVAPFRNFIQERISNNIGENYLFFGCRNRNGDYVFEKEWEIYSQRGLLHIFVAFSRDQDEKIYVQDKIKEQSLLLWDLIDNQGAYLYLAGNSKRMPDDVRAAIRSVLESHGGLSEENAEAYMEELDKNKRFQAETWS